MFTRRPIPQIPPGDVDALAKAVVDYLRGFNDKNALTINEAEITASQGIKYPAVQVSSTDANTQDDYEEGTWTPSDGSGAALAFTIDHATYTKIGRLVQIQTKLTYPATASGAGSQINGLPFAAAKQTTGPLGATAGTGTWVLVSGTSMNPEPPAGGGIANAVYTGATLWINASYYT